MIGSAGVDSPHVKETSFAKKSGSTGQNGGQGKWGGGMGGGGGGRELGGCSADARPNAHFERTARDVPNTVPWHTITERRTICRATHGQQHQRHRSPRLSWGRAVLKKGSPAKMCVCVCPVGTRGGKTLYGLALATSRPCPEAVRSASRTHQRGSRASQARARYARWCRSG